MACPRRSIPLRSRRGRPEHASGRSIARKKKNGCTSGEQEQRPSGCPPWIAVGGSPPRFLLGVCCANRGSRSPAKALFMSVSDVTRARDASPFSTAGVADVDPEIAAAIKGELGRQRDEIELIASENIVSRAVLVAPGSGF